MKIQFMANKVLPSEAPLRFTKGRDAVAHVASRFEALGREPFDDGWGGEVDAADAVAPLQTSHFQPHALSAQRSLF